MKIINIIAMSSFMLINNSNCINYGNSRHTTEATEAVNFLATADIHAGYDDSSSPNTIAAMEKRMTTNNNRGVIVAGDLVGNVKYSGNVLQYMWMVRSISNHLLAGFGNHDADSKTNQKILTTLNVKPNAKKAASLLYYNDTENVPVYSWNWSGIHFVQVSLAPIDKDISSDQNNNPSKALTKLKVDLAQNVNLTPHMPIVLSFHYGYDDFSTDGGWWNKEQRTEFENTILAKYNVILMLTGHLHFSPTKSDEEIYPVKVGNKTIYDVLPGTALWGGYSEVSINQQQKVISINRHDATNNDEIVVTKTFSYD